MPPMTTVASGLCTSEPVPVANAMGTNPRDATNAVISTGRKRAIEPLKIASCKGSCCSRNLLIKLIITCSGSLS